MTFNWRGKAPLGTPLELNDASSLYKGLRGYWFPGNSKNRGSLLYDMSLYRKAAGVLTANMTFATDTELGRTLLSDGTDDRVDLGNPAHLQNLPAAAFSVSAWFRPSAVVISNDVKEIIVAKSDEFDFKWIVGIRGSSTVGEWYATIDNDAKSRGGVVTVGQLYNVTMTYDHLGSKVCRIYVNGAELSSYVEQDAHGTTYSGDTGINVWLGAFSNGTGAVTGLLGPVGIWNRILTTAEIVKLYAVQTRWEMVRPLILVSKAAAAAAGWGQLLSNSRNRLVVT